MNTEMEILVMSRQIRKMMELSCNELMHTYGLRKIELDIMFFISCSGERNTAKDIIHERHISKAHISKSVDNLKNKGYIKLSEDSEDHRCIHIQITQAAIPVLEQFKQIREVMLQKLFEGITQEEKICLKGVIQKMMVNISKEID